MNYFLFFFAILFLYFFFASVLIQNYILSIFVVETSWIENALFYLRTKNRVLVFFYQNISNLEELRFQFFLRIREFLSLERIVKNHELRYILENRILFFHYQLRHLVFHQK